MFLTMIFGMVCTETETKLFQYRITQYKINYLNMEGIKQNRENIQVFSIHFVDH